MWQLPPQAPDPPLAFVPNACDSGVATGYQIYLPSVMNHFAP